MKKLLIPALVLLVIVQIVPANASQVTLKVGSVFSATFDNNIKYKGKDCFNLKFKYKGQAGLSYPAQTETIGLFKPNGDETTGYIQIRIGDTYGLEQGGDPNQGTRTMVLCQKFTSTLVDPDCDQEYQESIGDSCAYEEIGGIKPGKYYIQATVLQVRPTPLVKDSQKIFVTIYK